MQYMYNTLKRIQIGRKLSYIKSKIIPRALFTRILLLIIVPTIAAQLISAYLFYSKHWDSTKKYMIYTLAGEVSFIADVYKNVSKAKIKKINAYAFLQYKFEKNKKITPSNAKLPKELQILKSNLQYNLPNNHIDIRSNTHTSDIEIDIQIDHGILNFIVSKKRIFASSTTAFILWIVFSTIVLLTLSTLFAKNQIKSITRLSNAAEKFSQGNEGSEQFNPQGAIEVKTAGHALLKMKDTIEQQVKEKTKILAGVSHDLKTMLTRFKLQLEMMEQNNDTEEMQQDVLQMEKTINDYLDFAKGENLSSTKLINISRFLKNIIRPLSDNKGININLITKEKIYANIKENPFQRAISNFIDNSRRFAASSILIKLYEDYKDIIIEIHDDGPGLSRSEMSKVMEPFYRADNSRNQDFGGFGLGMSISHDIISKHNGNIILSKSTLGGLLVTIKIPK